MSQIVKPGRNNPDLSLNPGELAQVTMFRSTVDGSKVRQKETLLLGARTDGYMNLCEAKVQVLNVRLRPRHWPEHGIPGGTIRNWPELHNTIQTLVALQEGYTSLERFIENYTRKSAPKLRKDFINGAATLWWHEIDPKQIRPYKQK